MNDRVHQLLRSPLRTIFVAASVIWCGCSLIASQKNTDQCESDGDCCSFAGMICDVVQHVCTTPPPTTPPADAAGGGGLEGGTCWGTRGDASCFTCRAQTENELLNACSSSSCEPFSNTARIAGFDMGLRPPITM